MSSFDYLILAILGASGLLGFARGLMKELMSLVAYVTAFVAAIWWGPYAAMWLDGWVESSLLRSAIAYALTFVGVLLGIGLINMVLSALIEHTGLSPADHGLGMAFGLMRGVVFILILVIVAGYTQIPAEPWWQESSFAKAAIDAVIGIKSYLPPHVASWLPY